MQFSAYRSRAAPRRIRSVCRNLQEAGKGLSVEDQSRLELLELLEPDQVLMVWGDGHESLYPYRLLRENCTCARCVDEWSGKPLLDRSTIANDIRISRWEATGRYGLNLHFSDGHSSGIYTLRTLRAKCPCSDCRAADALSAADSE